MLRRKNSGFTLVEILIVVIILGILAAIVIPQFTNASQDARKSGLCSQLQTIRSQIELYKMQHLDKLPNLLGAAGWDYLTKKTDDTGAFNNADATLVKFGPYLQAPPVNQVNGLSTISDGDGTAAAAADCGWIYDYAAGAGTGKVWATDKDKVTIFVEN